MLPTSLMSFLTNVTYFKVILFEIAERNSKNCLYNDRVVGGIDSKYRLSILCHIMVGFDKYFFSQHIQELSDLNAHLRRETMIKGIAPSPINNPIRKLKTKLQIRVQNLTNTGSVYMLIFWLGLKNRAS